MGGKKMWYIRVPMRQPFDLVTICYSSKHGFQHEALAHAEQQAIKGHQNDECNTTKTGLFYIKKREMSNTYEPHLDTNH